VSSGNQIERLPADPAAPHREPACPRNAWAGADLRLFCLGLFCAIVQIPLGIHAVGFGLPYEVSTVATNLAESGEFRDPFGIPTGPTAHVAPVYAFVLATVFRILREPNRIVWATIFLNAGLLAFSAALLPRLSRRIYGRSAPGVIGGVLLALSGRLMPQWEVALAAALLLGATLAILEGDAAIAGLWCGGCLLTNPVALLPLAVLLPSRGRRFAAIASTVALVMCAPWVARNWVVLGAPYFVRDNLGLELFISNNDRAGPDLVGNDALWTLHPNQNRDEAAVVAAMGEAAYQRMRLRNAMEWVRSHRGRFLRLSLGRIFYYWLPHPREGWPYQSYWVLTVLGAAGVWLSRRNRAALLLAAAAVASSLPFVVIQTVGRYRFPSLWISALLAGYALVAVAGRWAQPKTLPGRDT
jgi:hypothetical protein